MWLYIISIGCKVSMSHFRAFLQVSIQKNVTFLKFYGIAFHGADTMNTTRILRILTCCSN